MRSLPSSRSAAEGALADPLPRSSFRRTVYARRTLPGSRHRREYAQRCVALVFSASANSQPDLLPFPPSCRLHDHEQDPARPHQCLHVVRVRLSFSYFCRRRATSGLTPPRAGAESSRPPRSSRRASDLSRRPSQLLSDSPTRLAVPSSTSASDRRATSRRRTSSSSARTSSTTRTRPRTRWRRSRRSSRRCAVLGCTFALSSHGTPTRTRSRCALPSLLRPLCLLTEPS